MIIWESFSSKLAQNETCVLPWQPKVSTLLDMGFCSWVGIGKLYAELQENLIFGWPPYI